MNELPPEIIGLILQKVNFRHLCKNCNSVNKLWRSIIRNKKFLIHLCLEKFINYPQISYRIITKDEYKLCFSLLENTDNTIHIPLNLYNASSTDTPSSSPILSDHVSQHAIMTISNHPDVFWSSSGTIEPCDEYITYGIYYSIGVVSRISVRFYEAFYLSNIESNNGCPCFASNAIKIEIKNEYSDTVYMSREFPAEHNNQEQFFELDKPVFVLQSYRIRLHLIGKRQKQESDLRYYTCLSSFSIYGIPTKKIPYKFEDSKIVKYLIEEIVPLDRNLLRSRNQLIMLAEMSKTGKFHYLPMVHQERFLEHFEKLRIGIPIEPETNQ